jgi:hypothetical protein
VDDFWEAPPAGGGGPLGLVAAAGVSVISANLSVRKVFKPAVLGAATATASLKVRRPMAVTVAGTASFSAIPTVSRTFAPTAMGQSVVTVVLGATTPATLVDIGPVVIVGSGVLSIPITVYRDIGSGVASGGGTELSIGLNVQKGSKAKAPLGISPVEMAQQLRSLVSDHREDARRAEGQLYSGILNPVTDHEEYPGIPLEEFDQYELAELVRQQEYQDQKSDYEGQARMRDQNLELAQRTLRIQRNRPQGLPRPPSREKLAQDILDKKQREGDWRNKANMARVRSFKKR